MGVCGVGVRGQRSWPERTPSYRLFEVQAAFRNDDPRGLEVPQDLVVYW